MDGDPRDRLIEQLQAENARLTEENGKLRVLIQQLQDRVEELERQAARQAAPFRRKDKDRKPPDQHKKPGRPVGHPPSNRPAPPQIDDHVEVELSGCPHCGGAVTDVRPCEQIIEDIPPIRPHVTRVVTYVGQCPRCGEVRSQHPMQVSTAEGAARVHLGSRALALAALLSKHFKLTSRTTCSILKTLAGLKISPGGLVQAMHRLAGKCEGPFETLLAELRGERSVNVDETSWWVGGAGWWLWVFTSPRTTVFRIDQSRGRDVVIDVLGEGFAGVLGSDCLATYENLPYRMQKCYAHHLKAIAQAYEDQPSDYLLELRGLLKAAIFLHQHRGDLSPPEWAEKRKHLDAEADRLLFQATPPSGAAKVANRVRKRRKHLFTFLDCPGVEPTNNAAEQGLRPGVISRKLSCGNKTEKGSRTWEILASLGATCHQRGQDFVEFLRPRLLLVPITPGR